MVLNELEDLIEKARSLKINADKSNKELKAIKEELRIFMIDSGIKEYQGVEIRRSFSFDVGALKMDYPKLYSKYVIEEEKTITKTTIDIKFPKKNKDKLREEHREAFIDCNVENTPQVRGL